MVNLHWPVLSPGAIHGAALPDRGAPFATAEIASPAAFGFRQAVIDAWAGDIPRLNKLQLDATNEFGILRGEHFVASAPTSSGTRELTAIRGGASTEAERFFSCL
jgi:hypothetical protein